PGHVSRRFPHPWMHDQRGVDADDVVPPRDDRAPPRVLDVALELDAERTVVEARAEPAVDLAARADEPTSRAEVHHLLHGRRGHRKDGDPTGPPAGNQRVRAMNVRVCTGPVATAPINDSVTAAASRRSRRSVPTASPSGRDASSASSRAVVAT